jgi:peptidylprolyl isomerase
MKRLCIYSILLLSLMGASNSFAKVKFSPSERKLITWADERRNADSCAMFLSDKDPNVAWRAAWAIANIEDSTSRPKLIASIIKEDRQVPLDGIAFALGVLGDNKEAYQTLLKVSAKHPTEDVFRALGRTVPKTELSSLSSMLSRAIDSKKVSAKGVAIAIIEVSLRKMLTADLADLAAKLAVSSDPPANWHAIYVFARSEDSALVAAHIDAFSEGLSDVGSPEMRMFSALALGRAHNDVSLKTLIKAARSETEWRVRVNIFNALSKMPRVNSSIIDVIRKATEEATNEDPLSLHVALSALMTLDEMLAAGKVSPTDSVTIRDWVDSYRPGLDIHPECPLTVRAKIIAIFGRLGNSLDFSQAASGIISFRDRASTATILTSLGNLRDTGMFRVAMERLLQSPNYELILCLEALHAQWLTAKKDPGYLAELDSGKFSNAYRHLIIRLPSQFTDPAIVTTAAEYMQDSLVIADSSFRTEMANYLIGYLINYQSPEQRDQLVSVLQVVKWLKPQNKEHKEKLNAIYRRACLEWKDKDLADTVRDVMSALGADVDTVRVAARRISQIDWGLIEATPDSILVQNTAGAIFIRMDKYNAPVTCMNLIKMSRINLFAQNYWHRVVPNFVVQGGDPTSTGSGGPGYSIRREVSNVYYDHAGVAGMASSGKDTEGSQYFFTHCPTPHLNSRYTVWGEIVEGMEFINKIQQYYQIYNLLPFSQ